MDILRAIIDAMPDRGAPQAGQSLEDGTFPTLNQAKVRLRVILETGLPPQTLKRVTSDDLDLRTKTVRTQPRRKGSGAKGRVLPLTDQAVDAWRAFHDAGLYGWYDHRACNRSFTGAVKRYRKAWAAERPGEPCPLPDDLHSYDLRHAMLSNAFRVTGNLKVVGYLAGHTEHSPLTGRYVQAAVDDVVAEAVQQISAAAASTTASTASTKLPQNPNKPNSDSDLPTDAIPVETLANTAIS